MFDENNKSRPPEFIRSSTENTGGSNPTPGAFGRTHGVFIQKIEPVSLSEIINFGLWMQKQGYRPSTIKASIQTLKSIARKAHLLNLDSTKTYLATATLSESRKSKLAEDLARFCAYKHIITIPHKLDCIAPLA